MSDFDDEPSLITNVVICLVFLVLYGAVLVYLLRSDR